MPDRDPIDILARNRPDDGGTVFNLLENTDKAWSIERDG